MPDQRSPRPNIFAAGLQRLGPFAPSHAEDLLDAWMHAARDATVALTHWVTAAVSDRRDAYVAYLAALDREERAATVLADAMVGQPAGA